MFCTNCGKEVADNMKFCPYCGKEVHRPAPKAVPVIPPEDKPEPTAHQVTESKPEPKITKKPLLIGIIAGAAIIFIIILIVIIRVITGIFGGGKYTVNEPGAVAASTAPNGYGAMSSGALNFSFLYPLNLTAMEQADGIYLYSADGSSQDIILVASQTGKEKPESYFKKYRKMMKESYQNPEFEKIREVNTAGKTLYMLRTSMLANGVRQTADRYLELYNDRYIEYTVMGPQAGNSDAVLQGIISSLVPEVGIYSANPNSSETGNAGNDTRSGGSFGGGNDGEDPGDYEDYGDYGDYEDTGDYGYGDEYGGDVYEGDVYEGDEGGLYFHRD